MQVKLVVRLTLLIILDTRDLKKPPFDGHKTKIFIYTDSTLSQTHILGNVQVLVLRYQGWGGVDRS